MTNHVGQSFAATVFPFNRFIHNTVSDDDENLGKVRIIRSKNDGIVTVGGKQRFNSNLFLRVSELTSGDRHAPFDEVTEIVEGVDGLLFILVEWQPGQPVREELGHVDALGAVLHDFGHSRDAVLRGVGVFFSSGVWRLDHTHEKRNGLWKNNESKMMSMKQKNTHTQNPLIKQNQQHSVKASDK